MWDNSEPLHHHAAPWNFAWIVWKFQNALYHNVKEIGGGESRIFPWSGSAPKWNGFFPDLCHILPTSLVYCWINKDGLKYNLLGGGNNLSKSFIQRHRRHYPVFLCGVVFVVITKLSFMCNICGVTILCSQCNHCYGVQMLCRGMTEATWLSTFWRHRLVTQSNKPSDCAGIKTSFFFFLWFCFPRC